VRQAGWVIAVLLSHWKRHPIQLATLLLGLISATALWSGVQALNQQARASYDRAAAIFGGARSPALVDRDGATIAQQLFVDLRRAGWAVSPMLEGRVDIGDRALRLIGVEPITLPADAGFAGSIGGESLTKFIIPPGETFVAPETLAGLGLPEGATPLSKTGLALPPLTVRPQLAPGVLVVDIGFAQRLLGRPDQISRLLIAKKAIGPQKPLDDVSGGRLRLVQPEAESDLEQLTDSFHLNLTAFGLLSFLVGLFIVNSAIGLTFEQRLPMLRTLRACGVSSSQLNLCLSIELVALALGAGFVGLIVGYGIAAALLPDVAASLRGLYGAQISGQLTLKPEWWIAGLAMSVAGALAAAGGSFVKLYKLSLLQTAQPRAWQLTQQLQLRYQGGLAVAILLAAAVVLASWDSLVAGFIVLGALLLGAALALPVILNLVLSQAERRARGPLVKWFWADSRQQLSGLSLALMALLLALAVNVGVGTMVGSFRTAFVSWLDGRLASEVYVSAASDAQAASIKTWLRQRPEVTAILPGARTEAQLAGQPIELLGLADHATYRDRWPLLEASGNAWTRLQTGDGAFVSEQLSRRLNIRIGDTLRVPTPAGVWPLQVAAIYADYGNPKGQIAVAIGALIARFPNIPQTRFGLRVRAADVPALIAALQTQFGLDDRQIADQTTVKAESNRIFNRTFAVTAALNTLTLGVAGLALLTSLLTLSMTRLPQIAPLWAMGLTLRRLSGIELLKTMMMALLTALLSLPLGLAVAWCLIAVVNVKAFGWRLPLHIFPMQLLMLLAVAMAAALLATLLPVLKLRRMPPAHLIKILANER
jgi:putative ABC transport system permease protein